MERGLDLPCLDEPGLSSHAYSLKGEVPYVADDISFPEGRCRFSAHTPYGSIRDLELGIPGIINIENALACVCLGKLLKISDEDIRKALSSFAGVRRRFDIRIQRDDMVFIDDYAHHPRELKACIESVRENFPDRTITGIFQPHLFSRTRDFAAGFAESLSLLDELILLGIYPAREEPIEGVTSALIFEKVELKKKILIEKEQLLRVLEERSPDLLLTLGAGDIDQLVDPIINLYTENKPV
jgi:UDP-N-acetylmuramate--alanine ligase